MHAPEEMLLGFARCLRAAGVNVTADRSQTFLAAVSALGMDQASVYRAGRATLCATPDDLARYEQVFFQWFLAPDGAPREAGIPSRQLRQPPLPTGEDETGEDAESDSEEVLRATASATEVLRHRDVADLSSSEKALMARMLDALDPRLPTRRASRRSPARRGDVDASRTLRATLRYLGEPAPVAHRRRGRRPRRLVLLVDVSGSMSSYADALLRLAHRFVRAGAPGQVEVFTVGTRLTHITRPLRQRDAERALVAAGEVVPDWSGGTRLGEALRVFLERWGRRGLARGAVVVIFSDGWERGEAIDLGEQVRHLRRLAHRVVWVNPHRGKPGYQPVQQGIVAVLPHLDDFVAGHSLATFAELTEVVARA